MYVRKKSRANIQSDSNAEQWRYTKSSDQMAGMTWDDDIATATSLFANSTMIAPSGTFQARPNGNKKLVKSPFFQRASQVGSLMNEIRVPSPPPRPSLNQDPVTTCKLVQQISESIDSQDPQDSSTDQNYLQWRLAAEPGTIELETDLSQKDKTPSVFDFSDRMIYTWEDTTINGLDSYKLLGLGPFTEQKKSKGSFTFTCGNSGEYDNLSGILTREPKPARIRFSELRVSPTLGAWPRGSDTLEPINNGQVTLETAKKNVEVSQATKVNSERRIATNTSNRSPEIESVLKLAEEDGDKDINWLTEDTLNLSIGQTYMPLAPSQLEQNLPNDVSVLDETNIVENWLADVSDSRMDEA